MSKLTNVEARILIEMMKRKVEEQTFTFPEEKGSIVFDVIGDRRSDEFIINFHRGGKKFEKMTYQGRLKTKDIVLMRLDINPTGMHKNPDSDEEIIGSHIHIYDEKHGDKFAFPFDVNDKNLYELCFTFFEKFNIVDPPQIEE